MSKKETFSNILGETRGGRVPPKSKIWGDVFYGWSLSKTLLGYEEALWPNKWR